MSIIVCSEGRDILMAYTKSQITEQCAALFGDSATFYRADFINYRGRCADTGELYSELIADYICRHINAFIAGIPVITRSASYRQTTHDGVFDPTSNRAEEIIAMQMFNYCKSGNCLFEVGHIIDYQTPLKSKRTDVAGKIDLLAYDGTTLRILELKKPDSEETMLRCVLEGYTYLRTVDRVKLLSDFELPPDTKVFASPLVFQGGLQWAELAEERPKLKQLMRLLESTPFSFNEKNEIVGRWPADDKK